MLAGIVLVASVATMTIASNPAFAVKHPHPHKHGASLTGSEGDEIQAEHDRVCVRFNICD